jgi:hypothetical protein
MPNRPNVESADGRESITVPSSTEGRILDDDEEEDVDDEEDDVTTTSQFLPKSTAKSFPGWLAGKLNDWLGTLQKLLGWGCAKELQRNQFST